MIVSTTIEEGPIWRLGKVALEGENLPVDQMLAAGKFETGEVANWKALMAGVENMNTVLKHDGFIGVKSTPVRKFQADGGVVDVTVEVSKGPQYRFASLNLTGLTDSERDNALRLWKLQTGQPMDGPYLDEYLKALLHEIHGPKKSVSLGMQIRPGTNQVDVVIAFKQG
ncbi:MAG: hypothetical protein JOZ48_08290 [Acidobacteriaceae bacterium]|nr:hypothetical protein [Acidobacteriaceae bacterium]